MLPSDSHPPSSTDGKARVSPTIALPAWFLGSMTVWNQARDRFHQGVTHDRNGAQHIAAGFLLMLAAVAGFMGWLPGIDVDDRSAIVWALLITTLSAVALGNQRRTHANLVMRYALQEGLKGSRNPRVIGAIHDHDRGGPGDVEIIAQSIEARRCSEKGSFDELINALVEARVSQQDVIAPLLLGGGMVFRTLKPRQRA